jgi:DNA polymerase
MFHPSFLLRNESRKKGSPKELTWRDINAVREKLSELQTRLPEEEGNP